MNADLEQLIDLEGLDEEGTRRLRRVHELLVAAGPSVDLPPALARPPANLDGPLAELPRRRHRAFATLLAAAAVAAACFGGGYVLANQAHNNSIRTVRVVSLQGEHNSFASLASASLRIGSADRNGNWPLELTVTGLPQLQSTGGRYVLMLWQNGKPSELCGTFRVGRSGTAAVTFNVPYRITSKTRWVVAEMTPGLQYPGHVVMTTS